MKLRYMLTICAIFFLGGCGILVGQFMVMGQGVDDLRVTQGSLDHVSPGAKLVVLGPFDLGEGGFHVSRGDDAAGFVKGLNDVGLFDASLHLDRADMSPGKTVATLKALSSDKLASSLSLDAPPELLLFGTIGNRETVVAPARGVVMSTDYRLELYSPASHKSAVVNLSVKAEFEKAIPAVVAALREELAENR